MLSTGTVISDIFEFRSLDDDAWYDVEVHIEGDVLRIRYCEFSEAYDNSFDSNKFRTISDVNELKARFRPLSVQIQDSECREVNPGLPVCASFASQHDDVRFHDAVVEGVDYHEHSYANGEEECLCKFILFWQHGPNAGNLTRGSIADMCRIQSRSHEDAVLETFFKRAREKIRIRMSKGDYCSGGPSPILKENSTPKLKRKMSFLQRINQETRCADRSLSLIGPCEDQQSPNPRSIERNEVDADIGGLKYSYVILLENLDRGLSPLRLAKFILDQTSILPRVFIFPSLSSETYARGALVLNCQKKMDGLFGFLDNPDHVVISSRGRPLVVTGRMARHDTLGDLAGSLELDTDNKPLNKNDGSVRSELKILSIGTKEFIIAKQMKELFLEFLSHQRRLHQSLAMEESKISLQ